MKRLFSAKGLAITAAILILLVVVAASLIDGIIKKQIETHGTNTVGARVELAAADLSFFPPGLELLGMDITDPAAPMTNAVSIERMHFAVDILQLLNKELIVEEMAMTGVRFNTPRSASGAIPGRTPEAAGPQESAGCKTLSLPPLKVPAIDDILGKESLQSEQYLRKLNADIADEKRRWTGELGALPGPETFAAYQQKIDALTAGGGASGFGALLSAPAELQALQKDIERDLSRLEQAQTDVQRQLTGLQSRVTQTGRQISADASRLARKYSLSGDGLQNLSRSLFGGAFCGWVARISDWYDRARGRSGTTGTGESKPAGDTAPKPGYFVWVKHAVTSIAFDKGRLNGTIRNISNQPARAGSPMTLSFDGADVARLKSVNIKGLVDFLDPKSPELNLNGLIRGLHIADLDLPGDIGIPVTIRNALADLRFDTKLVGESIKALAEAGLTQVNLTAGGASGGDPLETAIATAMSGITSFTALADATGTLSAYDIRIRSDMDQLLGQSVEKAVAGQAAQLEKHLNSAISGKLAAPRSETAAGLESVGGIQREIEKRLNLGDGLLKNAGLPF